jgi:hypothetical protein
MTKTVVFLEAGASKGLGLPVTRDILPELITRLTSKTSADSNSLFGGDDVSQGQLKRCLYASLPG